MSFGKVTPQQKEEVEKFGVVLYSWDEFLQLVRLVFVFLYFLSHLSGGLLEEEDIFFLL